MLRAGARPRKRARVADKILSAEARRVWFGSFVLGFILRRCTTNVCRNAEPRYYHTRGIVSRSCYRENCGSVGALAAVNFVSDPPLSSLLARMAAAAADVVPEHLQGPAMPVSKLLVIANTFLVDTTRFLNHFAAKCVPPPARTCPSAREAATAISSPPLCSMEQRLFTLSEALARVETGLVRARVRCQCAALARRAPSATRARRSPPPQVLLESRQQRIEGLPDAPATAVPTAAALATGTLPRAGNATAAAAAPAPAATASVSPPVAEQAPAAAPVPAAAAAVVALAAASR